MSDLTTLANVKAWLGITVTGDDTLLARLITELSAGIESVLSRKFAQASYSEARNGNGKTTMMVQNDPIISITSVTVDGVAIPAQASVGQTGYVFDSDTIYLLGSCFTRRSPMNVQLAYVGGFATVPADIDQAMVEAVAFVYRERSRIGLSSQAQEGQTTAYLRDLPQHLMRRFNQYNRPFRAPT